MYVCMYVCMYTHVGVSNVNVCKNKGMRIKSTNMNVRMEMDANVGWGK